MGDRWVGKQEEKGDGQVDRQMGVWVDEQEKGDGQVDGWMGGGQLGR